MNPAPTLSKAQSRVVSMDGVTLEGWDAKNRPVVSAMLGIPNQLRRWAIKRDGDPTDVTDPVRRRI
jgi:pantothenate kinase-related protein Tda10